MKKVDAETYELLVKAFTERPGVYHFAGEFSGVSSVTAKRAWLEGWPNRGLKPIRDLVDEIKIKARAAIEVEAAARRAEKEREKEDAHKNAVESLKQEGQMVMFARTQSIQNLTVAIELARSARTLLPELKTRVETEAIKMKMWNQYETDFIEATKNNQPLPIKPEFAKPPLTFADHINLLDKVAKINAQIVETAGKAMELERLHIGKPAHIIGVEVSQRDDVPLQEVQARLRAAEKAINMHIQKEASIEVSSTGTDSQNNSNVVNIGPRVGKIVRLTPQNGKQ